MTLPVSELPVLARFALLHELHERRSPAGGAKQLMEMALASYGSSGNVEGMERWWPFLRQLASDWIVQWRAS